MIPGLGSSPGEGNSNPLQCSCLENPMDREAWQAIGYGVTRRQGVKRGTRLGNYTTTILYKFQVNNVVIHNFGRLCSIYSSYKILALFSVLYHISL